MISSRKAWRQEDARFQAAVVDGGESNEGVICSKSYVSVHVGQQDQHVLDAACLSYNSHVAVYYLLLTSGRFASYRPEVNVEDLLTVPIPEVEPGILDGLQSWDDVDRRVAVAFQMKPAQADLVHDLVTYTLPDFKGDASSPGRRPTRDGNTDSLWDYAETVLKVLKTGLCRGRNVTATIFSDQENRVPVRLVAIHFHWPGRREIVVEQLGSSNLTERLEELNRKFLSESEGAASGGIYYQRVARLFSTLIVDGERRPSVYFVKPDRVSYWTRSMARRDADDLTSDAYFASDEDQSEGAHLRPARRNG